MKFHEWSRKLKFVRSNEKMQQTGTNIIIIIITLSTEVSERSNCRLVPYWREFLGVSGSRTWSDTPFANT